MRLKLGSIIFDPRDGIGSVPNQIELEYRGFAVVMDPKTFNRLVPPLNSSTMSEGTDYLVNMVEAIQKGTPVAPPYLSVDFQNRAGARVMGHEGRHRTLAIQSMSRGTDQKLLVHIFPMGGMRARHLTADIIEKFRQKAFPQLQKRALVGPLFSPKVWFNSQWIDLEKDLEPPQREEKGVPVLSQVERRIAAFRAKV